MRATNSIITLGRLVKQAAGLCALLLVGAAQAAAPGITHTGTATGITFDLVAAPGYISQPDGASIYSWGYGCSTDTSTFVPAMPNAACVGGKMQLPGPTLIVRQGDTVTVRLTNKLPAAAGNTSILFPGFNVTPSGGTAGLLTQEAANNSTVTYTFTATSPGTHSYYSGTQGDLQVEMGLYGALIVLPNVTVDISSCTTNSPVRKAQSARSEPSFRLADAAYNHASTCYDREYLFQFSEIDPLIHTQAQQQASLPCSVSAGCMHVDTEPYHAVYFLINGRSMPDIADPNYAAQYPAQPYNGNPHMHPGELTLVRVIGQGRMQHPFHEHGNHLRVLARDGNLLVNANNSLAGPLMFTTTTTPGQTMDAIFQWTAKGLNWDVYGHFAGSGTSVSDEHDTCVADANGYYTSVPAAYNFYEWCADHNVALESKPFGTVGSSGPVTLPDPNITALGAWYSGSPYFGPNANARSVGPTPIPPFGTIANDPGAEAGFAYMWHSHNEREITTNNIFPGGMMMMMLVDPWVFLINEAN
jgi:FtsP/CotA-like multicopper oxidase with cupredoxin domain